MRLVRAAEMQEMDRLAIEELGIPGVVLMENAGRGVAGAFLDHFSPSQNDTVVILCGRGNNGGDGYVVARYLRQAGFKVIVIVLSQLERVSGDARTHLEIIRKMGMQVYEAPNAETWKDNRTRLRSSGFIVDAIFGTGLNAPVRGFYGTVIDDINASGKPVLSIDIPSGLSADSGQVLGTAVQADLTITFGFAKLGHMVYPGAEKTGDLIGIDIGIPDWVSDKVPQKCTLTEPAHFLNRLRHEKDDIHKGNRGHLLILAGSVGKTGAATLAALGALRAGAGLVTLGVPETLHPILEVKLTEAMTVPLPETGTGCLSLKAWEDIQTLFAGKTAVALGPGLSTHPGTVSLVRKIASECPLPMVIDADGLNAIAGSMEVLKQTAGRTILTPHPGEMARLSNLQTSDIQKDRIAAAAGFVDACGCFLVLKGARTLVATPDGNLYVNPTGNPALASGGSGDVLTGLIAGFMARKLSLEEAAVAGPYVHGLSGDFLSARMGTSGVLAGELLDAVPTIMDCIGQGRWPLETPPLHGDFYRTL